MRKLLIGLLTGILIGLFGTYALLHRLPDAALPLYPQATTELDEWHKRGLVLIPTLAWEGESVSEPTVLYEYGIFRMWYTGSLGTCAIGYAESVDGRNWAKVAHPLIGQGVAGIAHAAHSNVYHYGDTYYLFFGGDSTIRLALSPDGLHFQVQPDPVLVPGEWDIWLANSYVWIEDAAWHMIYEARKADDSGWQMGHAESNDGLHWRKVGQPFTIGFSAVNGGPWVMRRDGEYHLYFHGGNQSFIPTDIYHAVSRDLTDWQLVDSNPVLPRSYAWETEQTGDASLVIALSQWWMYYTAMDNAREWGAIALATEEAR